MKRVVRLLLTFLTLTVSAQEAYVVRPDVVGCINVRDDSSTSANSRGCLPANAPVTVISSRPYWREIEFGQPLPGWIAKKFIVPAPGAPTPTPTPDTTQMWMTVHFVDVGQGDAIWIHTADDGDDTNDRFQGQNIVIDGGPYSSDTNNALRPYRENQGHHGAIIDALFVSHPHSDHYFGAETLVRHFEIDHYYDPGFPSTLSTYQAFINSFNSPGRTVNHTHRGQANFGTITHPRVTTARSCKSPHQIVRRPKLPTTCFLPGP